MNQFGGGCVKAAARAVDVGEGKRAVVRAIGEQDEDVFVRRVNPEACSGEAEMPEACGRKRRSGG